MALLHGPQTVPIPVKDWPHFEHCRSVFLHERQRRILTSPNSLPHPMQIRRILRQQLSQRGLAPLKDLPQSVHVRLLRWQVGHWLVTPLNEQPQVTQSRTTDLQLLHFFLSTLIKVFPHFTH